MSKSQKSLHMLNANLADLTANNYLGPH